VPLQDNLRRFGKALRATSKCCQKSCQVFFSISRFFRVRVVTKKDLILRINTDAEQSSTTGKAGGLKDPEPLKAVKNLGPPKGGYY
jgi:hypothetical protein